MTSPQPAAPHSKSRRAGSTVYLSGELGFDKAGNLLDGIETQVRNCRTRISATLKTEGLTLAAAGCATCYLADSNDFEAFNVAYHAFFEPPFPVPTTVIADLVIDGNLKATVIATDSENKQAAR